jgi:hypothetical protein
MGAINDEQISGFGVVSMASLLAQQRNGAIARPFR